MKIKNIAKTIATLMLGASVGISAFAFAGCKDPEKNPGDNPTIENPDIPDNPDKPGKPDDIIDPSKAKITVTADKKEIIAGSDGKITMTVTIEDFPIKTVIWTISGAGANYVEIDSTTGVITAKKGLYPSFDADVTVTATSTATSEVKSSTTITVKAIVISDVVADLKTEMFAELGNPSITVSGEVKDVYDDLTGKNEDVETVYDYKVMMSDGAWYGEWNEKGKKAKDISNYRRNATPVAGSDNHTFNQIYIDKNNNVAQKPVTDYQSVAAIWEEQHMWNHLTQLGNNIADMWRHDQTNDVYIYQADNNSIEDLYFRTYLAFSLTPMLGNGDTFDSIFITLSEDNTRIVKMEASTVVMYYGGQEEGSSEGATAMSYTTVTLNFTDVGTTEVPDPAPYEADEFTPLLQTAIDKMKGADNYTFHAVQHTVSAPSTDDGDYGEYSASGYKTPATNGTTNKGTEGVLGYVTSDAVLYETTTKYTAALDDNVYRKEYTGYKQISENIYDYFEYNADLGALEGKQQYSGILADRLPDFDFSANLFEYAGQKRVQQADGKWKSYDMYSLREPAVTRDIAMQISAHSYAQSAKASTYAEFTIVVNPETETVYSVEFPYNITQGIYLGTLETKFTKVGTTTLPEGTFDGYAARVLPSSWEQLQVKYYHATHNTALPYDEIDAGTLLNQIFGSDASKMPLPEVFRKAFGDTMSGPFFDWVTEDKTASGGSITYYDYISLKLMIEECDENYKISKAQHDAAIAVLTEELVKLGYSKSLADCGTTYYGETYTVYTNGSIMIKVSNNGTRFFDVDFLSTPIWWHYDHDLDTPPDQQ